MPPEKIKFIIISAKAYAKIHLHGDKMEVTQCLQRPFGWGVDINTSTGIHRIYLTPDGAAYSHSSTAEDPTTMEKYQKALRHKAIRERELGPLAASQE